MLTFTAHISSCERISFSFTQHIFQVNSEGVVSIFYLRYIGGESGHYEIYCGNTFLCSADTIGEAWNELLTIREELV